MARLLQRQCRDLKHGGSDVSEWDERNELDTLDVEASDMDAGRYCIIDIPLQQQTGISEGIRDRIGRVQADLKDLQHFYTITFSSSHQRRFRKFYEEEFVGLNKAPFHCYGQEEKIDYLLLQTFLQGNLRRLTFEASKDKEMDILLPFIGTIVQLCEDRQEVRSMDAQKAAQTVSELMEHLICLRGAIEAGNLKLDRTSAFRAAKTVDQLRDRLKEWFEFYNGYDPMFTWWVADPYVTVNSELEKYSSVIRAVLVGISPKDESAIVGEPIGREWLVADLNTEHIPYDPDEILKIGDIEYAWCETEMRKASRELGYGDDWRMALEYVKTLYVEPGKQTQLVHDLANEAIDYVTKYDLVTVPSLATETIAMYMMSPKRQMESPFFLGGQSILVSYPTNAMSHEAKLMSMRGNNIHFSRSTVFHELIPGHHLQYYMTARHRPYRQLFETCFWIEGWAFYWEMILWDDKRFPKTPENRIGMLFWRMHRCCRIEFSLKFHLGQITTTECVDLLVHKGGHERATAEGEVRRSFGGDYAPLYQAGYMLGALQLYSLRQELVDGGLMSEKQFHDRVMQEGPMPIELLRALLKDEPLQPNQKSSWRFYKGLETGKAASSPND